jgi:chemotaxis protein methyltransferase CheR
MTVTAANFDYVRNLVRRESAIVLGPEKEYLVEARLAPLARSTGAGTVDRLVELMRRQLSRDLQTQVVEALTTNETSWYRDGGPFTALRTAVLPEIMSRPGSDGSIRVWSAACASGQEPYSIAIELAEAAARPLRAEILATDLSPTMVERTRAARYSQLEVKRGMPAATLARYFTRQGSEWVVAPALRAMVTAHTLNLANPFPAIGSFDVVFLRNVLIYFDVPTKLAILRRVRSVLRPDAYLFLGSAEVTVGIDDGWERTALGRASFYRAVRG